MLGKELAYMHFDLDGPPAYLQAKLSLYDLELLLKKVASLHLADLLFNLQGYID